MNKKHEKSPCCGGKTIKHGGKRRQCVACEKTWTVWQKKRGRKAKRMILAPVRRYLANEGAPITRGHGGATRSARLRKKRDAFNKKQSWRTPPNGELILIADAILTYHQRQWHTWFFMLVRAVDGEDAVILPPYHRASRETPEGWSEAIDSIPANVSKRVKALVSDGHTGLMNTAKQRAWLIQRCHAHLLRAIQARRSRWSMGRHRDEAAEVHTLVECVLTKGDEHQTEQALEQIKEIGITTSSKILRKVLLGFVKHAKDYRTYLIYPELNLPTTSNTAESLNALIRDLSTRARGFRTSTSFNAWIITLCKARGTIKCRGKNPQN